MASRQFRRRIRAATLLSALALPAAPGGAHHSQTNFDRGRVATLEGTVTLYEWRNPHVYLHVRADAAAGEAADWQIEASPPALMARRGWSATTFSPGDRVVVEVSPHSDASRHVALALSVRTSDGAVLAGTGTAGAPNPTDGIFAVPATPIPAVNLAGTWTTLAQSVADVAQIVFGPTSWALTAAGQAALDSYDDAESPAADCIAYTAPFTMVFPDLKSVEVGESTVVIRSSLESAERIVHLDRDSHDGAPFTNQGHSIGRWDGEALVVETARFEARLNGNAFRLPSGRQKRLIERFELGDDRKRLVYTFTLEDPEFLTEPVSAEIEWAYTPGREFAAEGCDLENARRYLGR